MAQFLVTGGAGFIGSHIARRLVSQGAEVTIVDNFSTGSERNLDDLSSNCTILEGDLCEFPLVQDAVEGMEVVFHQAALPSVPRSVEDPLASHAANVDGTLNLLRACQLGGVRRVVYASSSSVYGDLEQLPKVESQPPAPISPYAADKLSGEYYCSVFHRVYGLETVALRYFNVFGPRQSPNSPYAAVIPRFIQALLQNESPTIYGDGKQSRDFTYVDNVVDANLLAAFSPGAKGEIMNLACGEATTLLELLKILQQLTGHSIAPKMAEPRSGDVRHSRADITKAQQILNYAPKVSLADGLERTVKWYREHQGQE